MRNLVHRNLIPFQLNVQCNWCATMLHLFHGNTKHLKVKRHITNSQTLCKLHINYKMNLYMVWICPIYVIMVNVFWLCGQLAWKSLKVSLQLMYGIDTYNHATCMHCYCIITNWHHGNDWLAYPTFLKLVINYVVLCDTNSYAIRFSLYKNYCSTIVRL